MRHTYYTCIVSKFIAALYLAEVPATRKICKTSCAEEECALSDRPVSPLKGRYHGHLVTQVGLVTSRGHAGGICKRCSSQCIACRHLSCMPAYSLPLLAQLSDPDLAQTSSSATAQHSTAQHSTAQHSTAQHSTAQHSTAQRSASHQVQAPYALRAAPA